MTLNIELPDHLEAALLAHVQAHGISADGYVQRLLQEALADELQDGLLEAYEREQKERRSLKPKKSAYGILAQYGPGPSEQEIDENRREMFRGFAEDVP